MVNAVGASWPASCAAIRARIQGFGESAYLDVHGKPIVAASTREVIPQRTGLALLAEMASRAIRECLGNRSAETVPLFCAISEPARIGRPTRMEELLLPRIEALLGERLHQDSRLFTAGEVGSIAALEAARDLLGRGQAQRCLVCGVDSLINAQTLRCLNTSQRLKTESNPDGLIPGEGAACVMMAPEPGAGHTVLNIRGLGFDHDQSVLGGDDPILGIGLAGAIKAALANAAMTMEDIDYRLTDATGERFWFADAAYGLARVLRIRKTYFQMWNISDAIGHTGAAAGVSMLAYLLYVFQNGLSPDRGVMLHNSCPTGERAVAIAVGEMRSRAYGE
jgi:3-oxoacyl-[acyl-carrier-protein] synthase-1